MQDMDENRNQLAARLAPRITEVQVLISGLTKELWATSHYALEGSELLLLFNKCIYLTEEAWLAMESVSYNLKMLTEHRTSPCHTT